MFFRNYDRLLQRESGKKGLNARSQRWVALEQFVNASSSRIRVPESGCDPSCVLLVIPSPQEMRESKPERLIGIRRQKFVDNRIYFVGACRGDIWTWLSQIGTQVARTRGLHTAQRHQRAVVR
jgi:hypothetical protein